MHYLLYFGFQEILSIISNAPQLNLWTCKKVIEKILGFEPEASQLFQWNYLAEYIF